MPLVICCNLDLPDGSGMDFLDEVRAVQGDSFVVGMFQMKKPGANVGATAAGFCMGVNRGSGSEVPDEIHCTPGETGAESGEHQLVAFLELALVFVQTNRN